MSTKISFFSLTLVCSFCFLFAVISPTYAAALPGNGSSLSISSTAVGLTFAGTSGNRYHFYLSVLLPIGLNPSNLTFGTPSTARSITDYDFISYAGNSVTVDFFYMSDGNSYTYQLKTLDTSFDLTQAEVISYGVVNVSLADVPGSTMFIYDKVLALRSWENVSHYLSSVGSTYALSTETTQVKDTDTTYSLTGSSSQAVTSVRNDSMLGIQYTTSPFVSSVGLTSSASDPSGMGSLVNNYYVLSSASLTGGLTSTTSFDLLHDEWGQFLDRVSTIGSLSLSRPAFNSFLPGDIYFPWASGSSMTVTPSSGFLYTNGLSPTYMTFVMDLSARPGSVSLSGVDLVSWSYSDGRLSIEAKKDNASGETSISLNSVSITLGSLGTNFPLLKIENFCVGSFEIPTMISNMDSTKQSNIIQRGFSNITSAISDLVSGLTLGYNSDTSSDLDSFNESASELDSSTTQYVEAEQSAMSASYTSPDGVQTSTVADYVSDFHPSISSYPSEVFGGFRIVGLVTNEMYERSGAFQYVVTFTLTLGCVLFVLGLRRR